MKKQLNKLAKSSVMVIIALAAICTTGYAQSNDLSAGDTTKTNTNQPKEEDEQEWGFFIVEDMPEFPCGEVGLRKYIAENTIYPEEAKNKGLEGKVFINFIVSGKHSLPLWLFFSLNLKRPFRLVF